MLEQKEYSVYHKKQVEERIYIEQGTNDYTGWYMSSLPRYHDSICENCGKEHGQKQHNYVPSPDMLALLADHNIKLKNHF